MCARRDKVGIPGIDSARLLKQKNKKTKDYFFYKYNARPSILLLPWHQLDRIPDLSSFNSIVSICSDKFHTQT